MFEDKHWYRLEITHQLPSQAQQIQLGKIQVISYQLNESWVVRNKTKLFSLIKQVVIVTAEQKPTQGVFYYPHTRSREQVFTNTLTHKHPFYGHFVFLSNFLSSFTQPFPQPLSGFTGVSSMFSFIFPYFLFSSPSTVLVGFGQGWSFSSLH